MPIFLTDLGKINIHFPSLFQKGFLICHQFHSLRLCHSDIFKSTFCLHLLIFRLWDLWLEGRRRLRSVDHLVSLVFDHPKLIIFIRPKDCFLFLFVLAALRLPSRRRRNFFRRSPSCRRGFASRIRLWWCRFVDFLVFGSNETYKFVNMFVVFSSFFDEFSQLFKMLLMRLPPTFTLRGELWPTDVSTSDTRPSFDIVLCSVTGSPTTFNHLFEIFLHEGQFTFGFCSIFFASGPFSF